MAKLFRSTSLRVRPDQEERPTKHTRNQSAFANTSRFYGFRAGDRKAQLQTDPYDRPSTSLDSYGRAPSRLETTPEEGSRFPKNTPATWTTPRKAPAAKPVLRLQPVEITAKEEEMIWHFPRQSPQSSISSPQRTASPLQRAPLASINPLSANPVDSPTDWKASPVRSRPIQPTANRKRQDSLLSPSSGKSSSNNAPQVVTAEVDTVISGPASTSAVRPKLSRWRSIGGLFSKSKSTPAEAEPVHERPGTAMGFNRTPSWMNLSGRKSALDFRPKTPEPGLQIAELVAPVEQERLEAKRAATAPQIGYRRTPGAVSSPPAIVEEASPVKEQTFLDGDSERSRSSEDSNNDAESIQIQTFAEPPVLKIEIPNINFERYSVMFNGILTPRRQSLLERRQLGGDRSSALTPLNTSNGLSKQPSRGHRRAASSPAATPSPSKSNKAYPTRSSSRSGRDKPRVVETPATCPRPRRQRSNTSLSKRSDYAKSTLDLVIESEEPPVEPPRDRIRRHRSRSSVTTASVSRPVTPADGYSPLSMLAYSSAGSGTGKLPENWPLLPTTRSPFSPISAKSSSSTNASSSRKHKHGQKVSRISPAIAGQSSEDLALALQASLNSPTDTILTEDWHFGGEVQVARKLSVRRAIMPPQPEVQAFVTGAEKKKSRRVTAGGGAARPVSSAKPVARSVGHERKRSGERVVQGKGLMPMVRESSGRRNRKSVRGCIEEA